MRAGMLAGITGVVLARSGGGYRVQAARGLEPRGEARFRHVRLERAQEGLVEVLLRRELGATRGVCLREERARATGIEHRAPHEIQIFRPKHGRAPRELTDDRGDVVERAARVIDVVRELRDVRAKLRDPPRRQVAAKLLLSGIRIEGPEHPHDRCVRVVLLPVLQVDAAGLVVEPVVVLHAPRGGQACVEARAQARPQEIDVVVARYEDQLVARRDESGQRVEGLALLTGHLVEERL